MLLCHNFYEKGSTKECQKLAGHTDLNTLREDGKKEIRLVNGKKFLWDKRDKTIAVQLPPPPPLPLPPPLPFLLAQGHAEKFSSDRSSGGGTGA